MKRFIIYIAIASIPLFSCKTRSVEAAQAKNEKMQRAKAREDNKSYKKAYKRHLNMQDSATKKRMKKQSKASKKAHKIPMKDRTKSTCPNQQV